jgi:hypothetical protein
MKKRHSRKFSQGGAALFLLFLLAHLLLRFILVLLQDSIPNPLFGLVGVVCLILLSVLLWFLSIRSLISQKLWRNPRSWYEACFALSAVYLFYALFIFVTGYTPTKYNSHSVSRDAGFYWLYIACPPFLVGLAAYVYGRKSGLTTRSTGRAKTARR